MLEIVPHPDEQRTYAELREEFRSDNLERIRGEFLGKHPVGWNMVGDPTTARDRYNAVSWCRGMLARLDAPVIQDFGLGSVPGIFSMRLEKQAQAAVAHDSVTWDEGEDQDSPACDLENMTDEEIAEYVDRSIRESACG